MRAGKSSAQGGANDRTKTVRPSNQWNELRNFTGEGGDCEDGGSIGSGEELEEEEQPKKTRRIPTQPSKAEIERHNKTHIPFRSWCPHCVRGRAMNCPHQRIQNRKSEVPVISMDYMYTHESLADRRARKAGEQRERSQTDLGAPILVMYDRHTGTPIAHVVDEKGVNPYALERMKLELRNLGYAKIVLKSDQEVSIRALKTK